jgi:hypothetical protein
LAPGDDILSYLAVRVTAHEAGGAYSAEYRISGRNSGVMFTASEVCPALTYPDSLRTYRRLLGSVVAFV